MPSKRRKTAVEAGSTVELNVPKELLDQLVKGPMTQGDLETMFRSLKKAVIERAMGAEMSDHLGYEPGDEKPDGQSCQPSGSSFVTEIGVARLPELGAPSESPKAPAQGVTLLTKPAKLRGFWLLRRTAERQNAPALRCFARAGRPPAAVMAW